MNKHEGYIQFFKFLDHIWENDKRRFHFTLPGLLGDMRILGDNTSADSAMQADWYAVWPDDENLDMWEVYQVGKNFLKNYRKRGGSDLEIDFLLNHWEDETYKKLWKKICVDQQ